MVQDSNSHTLDPGQSETGTLTMTRNTAGTITVFVNSDDDSASTSVEIRDSGTSDPTPTGDLLGYVRANYGGSIVNLPVYDPETVPHPCWRVGLPNNQTGAFHIEPRSTADYAGFSIETAGGVMGISTLDVEEEEGMLQLSASGPNTISEGNTLNVDVTAENTGQNTVTETVRLNFNGNQVDSRSTTVDGGQQSQFTLTHTPSVTGTHSWRVQGENDAASGEVTIEANRFLIDSFEHNDLTNYWESNTSHYRIDSAWAYDGSYCLYKNSDYSGAMLNSFSGLDTYPQEGDRINMLFRTNFNETTTARSIPSIRFGHSSEGDSFYECRLAIHNQRMVITENDPSTSGWNNLRVSDINLNFPEHTTVMFSVFWGSDNIGMRLFNDETGEAITPYISAQPEQVASTSGGIGVSLETTNSNHQMLADYIHVDNL